jgi:hypothetical protein
LQQRPPLVAENTSVATSGSALKVLLDGYRSFERAQFQLRRKLVLEIRVFACAKTNL